jgi:phosphoketolase
MPDALSPDLLQKMHAYWRAANYLSVGQIYLQDNPLLETPLEALAAMTLLREYVPDIRVGVVNVVDLMVLQPQSEHPHGLEDQDFDELFTTDKPVIFAHHGFRRSSTS